MAINQSFKHGKEPVGLAYRKRLWVFYQLMLQGRQLDHEKMADAKAMDDYFFGAKNVGEFTDACEFQMGFYKSSFDLAGVREPAPDDVLSWVSDGDRRFFSWAYYYWTQVLGYDAPFVDSGYISQKYKIILWLDTIPGFKEDKRQLEADIKNIWYQNNEINNELSLLSKKESGIWKFFWKNTLKEFQGSGHYQRALMASPGFDKPVGEEECYYSAVFLYDVADIGANVKIKIIRDIKRKLSNDKRTKRQVNVSLSCAAADKLVELKDNAGARQSEFVENLIWQEAQKQESD